MCVYVSQGYMCVYMCLYVCICVKLWHGVEAWADKVICVCICVVNVYTWVYMCSKCIHG